MNYKNHSHYSCSPKSTLAVFSVIFLEIPPKAGTGTSFGAAPIIPKLTYREPFLLTKPILLFAYLVSSRPRVFHTTLIKKKIKFSSYIGKFRVEQLQSHIWLTASSYMGKCFRISSYIRKPFLIYDFATPPLWISLYMRKILFSFLSVYWLPYFTFSIAKEVNKSLTHSHIFFLLISLSSYLNAY
jgi:hypothetical protein